MNSRSVLAAAIILAGIGVVLYIAFGAERLVPFTLLADAPRPAVQADRHTRPQVLTGLLVRTEPILEGTLNERRTRRNELAQRHAEAVALWRAGRKPLREVEGLEASLWAARRRAREIGDPELHRALVGLFEREQKRLKMLFTNGLAGIDQLERVRLYVTRERHLARLPLNDPEGRDYETQRIAYLAAVKRSHQLLIENGLGHPQYMQLEEEALEQEFPALKAPAIEAPDVEVPDVEVPDAE